MESNLTLVTNDSAPTLENINPNCGHNLKTEIKSKYGNLSLEDYYNKDDFLRYKINLKIAELTPEIAKEMLRVLTPFFENPLSPQLELFAEPKTLSTLPMKKEE
ncbi:hypothetical protein [Geminocystis sp. NIES-3709]|uniref:hypothetical protein n=1 Tax=Geminocystis sp. NIES-3709 TaxID=1617448 RepID=UPI0005FC864C|nr:hypothetical protein [Geminocystis sp. NIES-3709]BAQ65577.1 hypothetical protein GM3709_2342 [Geminocystis sp. NIES-3709]